MRIELLGFLTQELDQKLEQLNQYAKSLGESLDGESKSTAGDKHDTGRAMIHLEQEKLAGQFNQLQNQIQHLNQIRQRPISVDKVEIGSLIQLDGQYYFIGIPAGKISFQGQTIWCIGYQAPLAMSLLGKKSGEQVRFRNELVHVQLVN